MTHAAFLRAINIGGHAIVKMAGLKRAFEDAGGKNVRTLITSGNVVFEAPSTDAAQAKLFKNIQDRVDKLIGKPVDVMYRTHDDIKRLIAADPFADVNSALDVRLYVTFLKSKPAKKPKLPLLSEKEGLEVIQVAGLDVCVIGRPVGKGRSGAPNLLVEKEFGVAATSRNWNTVCKVFEKMAE